MLATNQQGNSGYSSASTEATPTDGQKAALLALEGLTTSDRTWTNNLTQSRTWICDWYGITCSNNFVTEVVITANNLSGSIEAWDLTGLPKLEVLDFTDNRLTGNFPTAIGSMTSLKEIKFTQNCMSGTLPTSLASLSLLKTIDLGLNEWVQNDDTIRSTCDSSRKGFTGIPESLNAVFAQVTGLGGLCVIAGNQFDSCPSNAKKCSGGSMSTVCKS
jgi:hypothetical protein